MVRAQIARLNRPDGKPPWARTGTSPSLGRPPLKTGFECGRSDARRFKNEKQEVQGYDGRGKGLLSKKRAYHYALGP